MMRVPCERGLSFFFKQGNDYVNRTSTRVNNVAGTFRSSLLTMVVGTGSRPLLKFNVLVEVNPWKVYECRVAMLTAHLTCVEKWSCELVFVLVF